MATMFKKNFMIAPMVVIETGTVVTFRTEQDSRIE